MFKVEKIQGKTQTHNHYLCDFDIHLYINILFSCLIGRIHKANTHTHTSTEDITPVEKGREWLHFSFPKRNDTRVGKL